MDFFPGFKEVKHGFCCFWTIENFSSYKKKLVLRSQAFTTKTISESKWDLELGKSKENADYLSLFIYKIWPFKFLKYKFSLWILTNIGWNPVSKHQTAVFKPKNSGFGLDKFIEWHNSSNENSEFLINDSLTLAVHLYSNHTEFTLEEFYLVSEVVSRNNVKHILQTDNFITYYSTINVPVILLSKRTKDVTSTYTQTEFAENTNGFEDTDDFLHLFKENKFGFVTIRTENKHFVVLKALLCARSPVFNAMFENNMIENGQNAVDIHDADCETISSFIQFLHLEPLGDLKWDQAVNLFYVADKYQVEPLKKECISLLKRKLSEDNVCESFILADRHDDADLKQATIDFFTLKSKVILRSHDWKEFLLNHTTLATEILSEFATKLW